MDLGAIKIKCEKPFGVIISPEARKFAQYAVAGAEKALIVSDETVFRLYGNGLKKLVKNTGAEAYTFIYPTGENGKSKHVLDKLLILMTELGVKKTDCVIAFGGRSANELAGFATAVFNGGVPYFYLPTTLMGMINPPVDGKAGVDFIGKKDLLRVKNYPLAVFADVDYLKTLPAQYLQDGCAEIIRRAFIADKKFIEQAVTGEMPVEQAVYSGVKSLLKIKGKKTSNFALNFSATAEKIIGVNVSYGKLIAFGITCAIDAGMTLNISGGLEEVALKLFEKYSIKWDIGISSSKMWQTILLQDKDKITLVLPKKTGGCKVVKLTKEKIKETF